MRIGLEGRLGAVAVMDVKIDDSDAFETMSMAGARRTDRDIVEETKAHGAIGLGVMAGGSYGAKRIAHLARHDGIGGSHDSAGRAQRRLPGAGRERGIGIDSTPPLIRDGRQQRFDEGAGMDHRDIGRGRAWSIAARERGKMFLGQGIEYGAQARRRFRVARAWIMLQAGSMCDERGRHRRHCRTTVSPFAIGPPAAILHPRWRKSAKIGFVW